MSSIPIERWKLVSPYLDRALELSPADREVWLTELTNSTPDIAADVRTLLAAREENDFDGFLADSPAANAVEVAPAVLAGKRVGPYILEREIGRGGMGSVWFASRGDGRYDARVAVKLLTNAWVGEQGSRRFRREGNVLARLDHPNVARLLDAGVTEGGQPYLVLEYVEGSRIDEYANAQQLSVRARLRLFVGVLAAVSHAHRQLIIHRDIKPSNIFVTNDGTVKLLDFGIAKLITHDESTDAQTRADSRLLTPEYAAPEQLLGQPVTTATDVYSLGVTLYVLLTGQHPFPTVSHSLEAEVPRLLRGDLDSILRKALRKQPNERYASVDGFADDLRRFLNHEPVSAGPDSVRYRVGKFVRRHRGAVVGGVLTAIVLIAAVITTSLQMIEARRQRDEARFQARRAESANEFLNVLLLSDGGPDKPPLGRVERLELGARIIEQQYRDDPQFAGRMLVQLGRQFRGLSDTRRAVELMTRAYVLGQQQNDIELMARAQCTAAYAEVLAQALEPAKVRLVEAHDLMGQLSRPDVGLRVDCLQAEGQLELRSEHYPESEALLIDARRLLETSGETHRAAYTSVLNDLGGVYMQTYRLRESLDMAKLVGATHERYGRGGTSARLTILSNQTVSMAQMGETVEALALFERILKRARELESAGAEHFSYGVNRAAALNRLDRPEEALVAVAGLAARARSAENKHWLLGTLRTSAMSYAMLGRFDEAERDIQEATAVLNEGTAPNLAMRIPVELARARVYMGRGELESAQKVVTDALTFANYPEKKQLISVRAALAMGSEIAFARGQFAESETYARNALEMAEAVTRGPDTSGDVGEALVLLARARLVQGKRDAGPLLERALPPLTHGLGPSHRLTVLATSLKAASTDTDKTTATLQRDSGTPVATR